MTPRLTEKELEKGCGNVAVQCGNNIAYCDGNILCKECLARLEGFKEALILENVEILEKIQKLKVEFRNVIQNGKFGYEIIAEIFKEELKQNIQGGKE